MALPAAFDTRAVHMKYTKLDGTPAVGTVTFTVAKNQYLDVPGDHVIVVPTGIIATLDQNGEATVTLPITNDEDVDPSFAYVVTEKLGAGAPKRDPYTITVPAGSGALELDDVDPNGFYDATTAYVTLAQLNALATGIADTAADDAVDAHVAATDPHGDRVYADGAFIAKAGGTVTGDLTVSGRLTSGGITLPLVAPSTQRPLWRSASWSQLFQSGHGWTLGGSGTASSTDDTSAFVKGTQSVRLTTAANAGQSSVRKIAMPALDLTDKAIRVTFKVQNTINLDRIEFYAGTSNFASNFMWTPFTHTAGNTHEMVQEGEWVTLTFGWPSVSSATGYTLSSSKAPSTTSGFTDLKFVVYDNGGGVVTYNVQSIELIDATSTVFPNGVVSITFDDSWQSVYDLARPIMDGYGYRGTTYTIADTVGTSQHVSLTELKRLQNLSGWEIGGHAFSSADHNARLTTMTAAQVDDDLRKLRAWLISNGFNSDGMAYPGGGWEATTDGVYVDTIATRYFGHGRTISGSPETFPAANAMRLRALTGINDGSGLGGTTVATITAAGGALDRAANGSWLILCFHELTTGAPTENTQISKAGFQTVMDAIAARGIDVLPVSDVLRNGR